MAGQGLLPARKSGPDGKSVGFAMRRAGFGGVVAAGNMAVAVERGQAAGLARMVQLVQDAAVARAACHMAAGPEVGQLVLQRP